MKNCLFLSIFFKVISYRENGAQIPYCVYINLKYAHTHQCRASLMYALIYSFSFLQHT